MATKKKGVLTVSLEWAKHLRPWGKKKVNKAERAAAKTALKIPTHFIW